MTARSNWPAPGLRYPAQSRSHRRRWRHSEFARRPAPPAARVPQKHSALLTNLLARTWFGLGAFIYRPGETVRTLFWPTCVPGGYRPGLRPSGPGCAREVGQDSCWMPKPHGPLPTCEEALQQVVHGKVARSTCQHFLSASHGLANQLHDGGGLARAGRTVKNGQVRGGEGETNRLLLGGIQCAIERHERSFRREGRGYSPSKTPRNSANRSRTAVPERSRAGDCLCRTASSVERSSR